MEQDPIVDEVRRIRREIERECGDDFSTIRQRALSAVEALAKPVVNRAPVRRTRPSGTGPTT